MLYFFRILVQFWHGREFWNFPDPSIRMTIIEYLFERDRLIDLAPTCLDRINLSLSL